MFQSRMMRSLWRATIGRPGAVVATVAIVMGMVGDAKADLIMTVEAPGVQTTSVAGPGVTTETFDEKSSGFFYPSLATSVGTIATQGRVNSADEYGGAGGSGNYLAIGYAFGAETTTLTLDAPKSFFGFWWSAEDSGNSFAFLSGGKVVASINYNVFTAAVDALSPNYLGNPNSPFLGDNNTQNYVYVNVFGTSGTKIDQVVFTDSDPGTLFEMDNWSASSQPVTQVGTPIAGLIPTPEPSSMVLAVIAGVVVLGTRWRTRRVTAAA